MWFSILGEHGLLAIAVWVALIISCLFSIRRLKMLSRRYGPEFEWVKSYGNMLQGTFIAYLVAGTFLDVAYFDLFYELVCTLVIAKEVIGKSTKGPVHPESASSSVQPTPGWYQPASGAQTWPQEHRLREST
jgi:hypothetical protein